jgi:hypothetical protein
MDRRDPAGVPRAGKAEGDDAGAGRDEEPRARGERDDPGDREREIVAARPDALRQRRVRYDEDAEGRAREEHDDDEP